MGLCEQLRQDCKLTAGASGFTTWNETVENLSDVYVSREGKRFMGISEDAEAETKEEYTDVPHGSETVCDAATSEEKPIRDAMSGQVLDRGLVAAARQKELKYFLVKEVWLKRPRSEHTALPASCPFQSNGWMTTKATTSIRITGVGWLRKTLGFVENKPSSLAPTLPLEALRTVLSAASTDWKDAKKKHIRNPESE